MIEKDNTPPSEPGTVMGEGGKPKEWAPSAPSSAPNPHSAPRVEHSVRVPPLRGPSEAAKPSDGEARKAPSSTPAAPAHAQPPRDQAGPVQPPDQARPGEAPSGREA